MTGNIILSYKGKTAENTVIEDVEEEIYELTDSDSSKSATRVFDKIDHGEAVVLPMSIFLLD